ncbi:MAG: ferritin [Nanoarchaeota archaeon]
MLQEDGSKLSDEAQDLRRAIDSLREEMEAVNFYTQRAELCRDANLKKILLHNSKEEKEHAAMLIEWIRRHDSEFAHEAEEYFNSKEEDIVGEGH